MKQIGAALSAAAALSFAVDAYAQRAHISVAGSSTVRPYAEIVAEAFGEAFPEYSIVVEGGGSSGGLRRFCAGVGLEHTDVSNASRAIRSTEIDACAANGVSEILEVLIGYDGIVFAYDNSHPKADMTPADIYRAVAAEVVVNGELVANPYNNLSQIRDDLPAMDLSVLTPASNHGTREVFDEKVVLKGCEDSGDFAVIAEMKGEDAAEEACTTLRADGRVTEIAGDYTETLAGITSDREAIGVFGLAFYENNRDRLNVADILGVTPSQAAIASGDYPVSRPLYIYVKVAHLGVVPGLQDYIDFFVSDEMTGDGSPTNSYGLVMAPADERAQVQAATAAGEANL